MHAAHTLRNKVRLFVDCVLGCACCGVSGGLAQGGAFFPNFNAALIVCRAPAVILGGSLLEHAHSHSWSHMNNSEHNWRAVSWHVAAVHQGNARGGYDLYDSRHCRCMRAIEARVDALL